MTTSQTSPELASWLIEQSPDATIYSDIQGHVRVWNAAATRMFGFSAEQALGQSLDIIIPENYAKHIGVVLMQPLQQALLSTAASRCQLKHCVLTAVSFIPKWVLP